VVHRARARLAGGKARRGDGLLPGGAAILTKEDGGAEVPLPRGAEKRAPVARVEHRVVHLLAEKVRVGEREAAAIRIGGRDKNALSR